MSVNSYAALLAVSQDDADVYKRIYPDLLDAKVFIVDDPRRMEGYRTRAVHATARAHVHPGYWEAYGIMRNNFVLSNRTAPRVL